MKLDQERRMAVNRLRRGEPPGHSGIVGEITVGVDTLSKFHEERYLREYIPNGGNRIQFLTGKKGSGKTHYIEYFLSRAVNYKTVYFSARKVWLHDFKDIFFEVLRQCDLEDCLRRCVKTIIRDVGFPPDDVPTDARFTDFLAGQGLDDPFTKREIRLQLNRMFLGNPLMDNNFSIACGLLAGGLLGHPILEEPARDTLLGWLSGRKDVKLPALKNLGLSPMRINKYNARHMLRSLVEIVGLAGYDGLVIAVDDLDILVSKDSLEEIHYTKAKRDDVYESLRELIDEIDTLRSIFFLFAFDRRMIDDERLGLKSYQALWFRIQNEIKSGRLNRFSNMIDMDRLQVYDLDTVIELSARVADLINGLGENPARPIEEAEARELMSRSDFSELSLPRLVIRATVAEEEADGYGL